MIFGWGKKQVDDDDDDDDEEEIEYVLFQGSLNGIEPDMKGKCQARTAGLLRAKELVTSALDRRAEMNRLEPKGSSRFRRCSSTESRFPAARCNRRPLWL